MSKPLSKEQNVRPCKGGGAGGGASGGGAGGASAPPPSPNFLKILKSYWEKVFSVPPLWVSSQLPPPPPTFKLK